MRRPGGAAAAAADVERGWRCGDGALPDRSGSLASSPSLWSWAQPGPPSLRGRWRWRWRWAKRKEYDGESAFTLVVCCSSTPGCSFRAVYLAMAHTDSAMRAHPNTAVTVQAMAGYFRNTPLMPVGGEVGGGDGLEGQPVAASASGVKHDPDSHSARTAHAGAPDVVTNSVLLYA